MDEFASPWCTLPNVKVLEDLNYTAADPIRTQFLKRKCLGICWR